MRVPVRRCASGLEQRQVDGRRELRIGVELGAQRRTVEEQELGRDERDDRRGRPGAAGRPRTSR